MRLPWPPIRLTRATVRRLRRAADAARDAGRWQAAAALYEQALALGPGDGALHVQCGHMFKEAGELGRAAEQYRAAAALLPDDADLALQLGHFHKVAGRPAEAEAAYARALALRPGWGEAAAELGGLRPDHAAPVAPLPELLPALAPRAADETEALVVRRLGAALAHTPAGLRRVLSGVEAVRGHLWLDRPPVTLSLTVDGAEVRRERIAPVPGRPRKHVFNLWHDFSTVAAGERRVELHLIDGRGRRRSHRVVALVRPPDRDPADALSDAAVPPPPGDAPLDARIDALPSVVRSAARGLPAAAPRAVLVQRVDQLGDLACSVPAIRRLRALFAEARLVGLLSPANTELGRGLGLFDAVLVADLPEAAGRRAMPAEAQRRLADELARHRFDLAIDLSEDPRTRPLLRLSGAPFLCGFGPRRFPWLQLGLDLAVPDPHDRLDRAAHGRRAQALVETLAVLARPAAVAARAAPAGGYALLHAGARLAFSRWPGFAALAALLLARTALDVVLVHDPGDRPVDLPDDPRLRALAGPLPFAEFDALVGGAALFVGNDSGPKHLAALRGVPVVSLHMARLNWDEWGQEGSGVIVSRRVPCAGCGIADEPDECGRGYPCLTLIRPEEVLAAALDLIGRSPARPAAPAA